jgi:hypothetical protein
MRLTIVLTAVLAASPALVAQGDRFQFVIAVADGAGRPVTDLTRQDVRMSEEGVPNEIVKVEPFRLPVTVTLAVDNGPLSRDALSHYRAGLSGLVRSLPADVEVSLLTISPQPMTVVPASSDRARILRGINGFAPQDDSPRFTDALVEFSRRLEDDVRRTRRISSIPVLVMVSTTATEAVSYATPEIQRAIAFLEQRKARVFVTMLSVRQNTTGFAPLNEARQPMIAVPATKVTGGRYEAIAASSRLVTLLPELAGEITTLHLRHANQLLVTAQRERWTGPLRSPRIEIARPGLTGTVSENGLP